MALRFEPSWIVWHPAGGEDGPNDGRRFFASSAADAASKWGQWWEEKDYDYTLCESPETVCVRDEDTGAVQVFRVRSLASWKYFADPVSDLALEPPSS